MLILGKFIAKFPTLYFLRWCIAIIFILSITNTGYSQTDKQPVITTLNTKDTLKTVKDSIITDTNVIAQSALKKDTDTRMTDTSRKKMLEDSLGIIISKDALTSEVKSKSDDSAVLDIQSNLFYLYGNAQVNYENLQLNAGQITYDQRSNVVTAAPYAAKNDTGAPKQTFTQGNEKFTFDSLQYNFKSQRAIVRNVHSQYGQGYMHSEQVKRNPDQTIFGARSVYTTCALDTPHFGITAYREKVIPGHLIVTGPANLTIEGVPTPLWLPFGLFPISEKQRSGFLLPTYTIEQARGLGLLNGGYYFYLNEHADLLTQANFYTKGSYAVSGLCNYNEIYKYRGSINFSYAFNKTGEAFEPGASIEKDFMLNWRHQSDAKAIPGETFNASVQAGTSTFYSNNSYDPNQILQNQYSSNISFSKTWQGKPLAFTISALHSQNTQTKQINVTLPSIDFHITSINPFQRKKSIGVHWYDKITLSYTTDLINRTTFYDSTLNLSRTSLSDFKNGIKHTVPVSASYTIFRYINMSFSFNYDEYWLTDKIHAGYNNTDAKIDTVETHGFYAARDFNTGVSFSTRIYGMKLFKKGRIRGIRHVVTPSVGFSYHPDFGTSPFNYYYRTRLDSTSNYYYQSPFVNSIISYPTIGKQGAVNFGLNNNLQIKVKSSKDTVTGFKNITLIDALGLTTSYNAAVDSFQWGNIAANFRTNILDKVTVTSTANFSPYAFDYTLGRQLPQTMEDKGYGLARFTNATFALGSNIHSKPVGGANNPTTSEEYTRLMRNAGYNDYVDFNIPWSLNLSYSLAANLNYNPSSKRDTLIVTHNLMTAGEVQITKRWKLTVSSGFNFSTNQLTSTSIDIYRDLHCWQMHLQTIPFGPRKSYSFTLNVKASVLQDLKLTRRRDYRDTPY